MPVLTCCARGEIERRSSAMVKVDQGHAALTTLARTYGQLTLFDANEAETRLKVIDETIFNVLGWEKEDVRVEERVSEDGNTSFADYVVRTASTAILIEAKKAKAAFSLPSNRMKLRLGGVLSEGEVGEAIRQARDYCRSKSIPFAAVTNGSAWIIFPAIRTDQVSFDDSEARIFRDLDDVARRFVDFWELLSRERTLEGNLEHELLGRKLADLTPLSLRQILPEPGYRLGRNALYEHLEPAISLALTDEALLGDAEALRRCYVKTSERVKYDNRLQVHLHDRMPALGHKTVRVRARSHEGRAERRISEVKKSGPKKFIVLLGPVGAGKTTFLHYTRKVSAAAAINTRVMWFLIDFKKATQSDDPREFILKELLKQIEEDSEFQLGDWNRSISPAYRERIDALRRGALFLLAKADPKGFDLAIAHEIQRDREAVEPYVEAILQRAAGTWPGFLVIDNVDQLDDLDIQEQIFTEAQALARRAGLNVIMSLRESTFIRHRERPVFDAFEFDSFYVDPPNVLPVLAHRFTFARKVLENVAVNLQTEHGMTVRVPDLGVFFDIVARSLLDDETGLLIEALAGGNIRRGLALVREFLASGHTNADHAIATYLTQGTYKFPRHEFFRGAILGSFRYYNDAVSLIPNLFDAKFAAPSLQLLRLNITDYLVSRATRGLVDGVLVSDLVETCARVGVPQRDVLGVVQELGRRELCRSVDGLPIMLDSLIVPTRLAAYATKQMCRDFAYADFCCVDSTILDPETLAQLREVTLEVEASHSPSDRVALRRARIEIFMDYLVRCEERWTVECKRREISDEWMSQIVKEQIRPAVLANADAALASALKRQAMDKVRSSGQKMTDDATYGGRIANAWPDKDYVFIRQDDGTDWFGHRSDFVSDRDWQRRSVNAKCLFLHGLWRGKPRATGVRLVQGK
jgi:hypothetical protein